MEFYVFSDSVFVMLSPLGFFSKSLLDDKLGIRLGFQKSHEELNKIKIKISIWKNGIILGKRN